MLFLLKQKNIILHFNKKNSLYKSAEDVITIGLPALLSYMLGLTTFSDFMLVKFNDNIDSTIPDDGLTIICNLTKHLELFYVECNFNESKHPISTIVLSKPDLTSLMQDKIVQVNLPTESAFNFRISCLGNKIMYYLQCNNIL